LFEQQILNHLLQGRNVHQKNIWALSDKEIRVSENIVKLKLKNTQTRTIQSVGTFHLYLWVYV